MKAIIFLALTLSTTALAIDANYRVPVPTDRPDLLKVSENMATGVQFFRKGNSVQLKYKLPTNLTGGQILEFKLANRNVQNFEKIVLDGENTFGVCQSLNKEYECEISYTIGTLGIDRSQAMSFLENLSPIDELKARQEVTGIFIDEARGVFPKLTLKSKSKRD